MYRRTCGYGYARLVQPYSTANTATATRAQHRANTPTAHNTQHTRNTRSTRSTARGARGIPPVWLALLVAVSCCLCAALGAANTLQLEACKGDNTAFTAGYVLAPTSSCLYTYIYIPVGLRL